MLTQEWKERKAIELTPQTMEVIISELDRDENMKGFLLRFLFEDALTRAIRKADVNGDGMVDADEFVTLIREVEARVRDRSSEDDIFGGSPKYESKLQDTHIDNVFMSCYQAVDNRNLAEPCISNEILISLISQCQLDVSKDKHLIKLKQLLLKSSGVEEIDDAFTELMGATLLSIAKDDDPGRDPGDFVDTVEMTPGTLTPSSKPIITGTPSGGIPFSSSSVDA